jgi:hypothetical protein
VPDRDGGEVVGKVRYRMIPDHPDRNEGSGEERREGDEEEAVPDQLRPGPGGPRRTP